MLTAEKTRTYYFTISYNLLHGILGTSTICGLYFLQKAVAAGSDLTPPPCITNSTKSPTLSTTTNKTLSVHVYHRSDKVYC